MLGGGGGGGGGGGNLIASRLHHSFVLRQGLLLLYGGNGALKWDDTVFRYTSVLGKQHSSSSGRYGRALASTMGKMQNIVGSSLGKQCRTASFGYSYS